MRAAATRLLIAVIVVAGVLVPGAGPAGSESADPGAGVPGVSASGYQVRYLVEPNPLNSTGGMALDGKGGLFICQALSNRVVRLDLATGELTAIADETDAQPLLVPDDMAMGPDGNLYVAWCGSTPPSAPRRWWPRGCPPRWWASGCRS